MTNPAEANRAISEFYLKQTLSENTHWLNRCEEPFSEIERCLKDLKIQIPQGLQDDLGLYNLYWQTPFSSDFTQIFLGSTNNSYRRNIQVAQAEAIVEVTSRAIPIIPRECNPATVREAEKIAKSWGRSAAFKREPISLRISGVCTKEGQENRIVAVTYDCKTLKATRVNISLTEAEVDTAIPKPYLLPQIPIITVPTPLDTPYQTAALITEAMVRKAPGKQYRVWNLPRDIVNSNSQGSILVHGNLFVEKTPSSIIFGQKKPLNAETVWQMEVPTVFEKIQ